MHFINECRDIDTALNIWKKDIDAQELYRFRLKIQNELAILFYTYINSQKNVTFVFDIKNLNTLTLSDCQLEWYVCCAYI